MQQLKINHHYVPRFYLDNFADGERFCAVFDKQHRKVTQRSNKSLCSSNHYYDLPATLDVSDQALFQVVENKLSKTEETGKRMLKAIMNGVGRADTNLMRLAGVFKRLNGWQIRNLAGYIALQYLRTESARELIRREHNAIGMDLVRAAAAKIDPTYDTKKLGTWAVSEDWVKWYHILAMFDFPEYSPYFERKIFIIGVNTTGKSLITSDNPVVLIPHEYDDDPRLDSYGMRLVFPISPTIALCAYEHRFWNRLSIWDGQPKVLEEQEIELFNEMQLLSSRKQIFGVNSADLNFAGPLCERYPDVFVYDQSGLPKSAPDERKRLVRSLLSDLEPSSKMAGVKTQC
jgi:hypothetical protein